MPLEGYTDFSSSTQIHGWVYDTDQPDQPLSVEIVQGETVLITIVADVLRPDLLAVGKGNGRHAFSYTQAGNQSDLPLVARVGDWLIPLGSFLSPSRYQGKFHHPMDRGIPAADTAFIPIPTQRNDTEIVERLIESYHRATADQIDTAHRSDMWSPQADAGHRQIIDLLQERNIPGVAAYLRDAHARPLTNGITQGDTVTATLRARADARQRVAAPFVDYLVSLAEFLNILNVECSDQASTWAENLYLNPQMLVDRISAEIGIDLIPPQVIGSLFGIRTARGILSGRDLMSVHTALRLKQLGSPTSICEIGGGLGGVAYYANRLGIRHYTIIDLPIIGVLQAYYLFHALPGTKMQLYGEIFDESAQIHLLPTYCFDRDAIRFDVLLNQDSMPEMHRDYAIGYLQSARKNPTHLFLSVNQEARALQTADSPQSVVSDLVRSAGGYQKLNRTRHWIRPGYVEELYRLES